MTLTDKTALISGAAGAIGAAVARSLLAMGARVILLDRAAEPLAELTASLGDRAVSVVQDLTDEAGLRATVRQLIGRFGRIDVLVNNAGILTPTKAEATSMEEWRRVMAVNLDAAFILTQEVLPGMRAARWGRIINMSSYAAKSGGLTAGTAYSVSKSAMIGLTYSIARETAADGITVNAVAPAYVMSAMVSEQLTEAQRAAQLAQIPVGRFCQPEEVAHAIAFLAAPLAGFITGEVIDLNGGLHFD
jgi:3-oxoacyl-[acyl-carrier protein] reductase